MAFLPNTLLAFLAGALIPLSLAPFNFWPCCIVAVAVLLWLIEKTPRKKACFLAWCFGLGEFLIGVSWVYISIHDQSNTPAIIAVPMTLIWCAFLALFPVLFTYAYKTLYSKGIANIFLAASLWVMTDWLRGWILTGFPWLYIGHSQINTALAGWAPISGVLSISFILVSIAGMLVYSVRKKTMASILLALSFTAVTFLTGHQLNQHQWTKKSPTNDLNVTLIQANIPQQEKWLPHKKQAILQTYLNLLESTLEQDTLFIFPETALPDYQQNLTPFLNKIEQKLLPLNSSLFTGLVSKHTNKQGDAEIYNSIISLGTNNASYHKAHLVPFGEYLPFEWLRGLINFFNLPMSSFSPGPTQQAPLNSHGKSIAPFICYEIVYPKQVRLSAQYAEVLLTISNDTWFGRSLAPPQHMQIAQFRALENGRYLIRATNNGISAISNEKGKILTQLPQFEPGILHYSIPTFTGQTPYNKTGDIGVLSLCLLIIAIVFLLRAKPHSRLTNNQSNCHRKPKNS